MLQIRESTQDCEILARNPGTVRQSTKNSKGLSDFSPRKPLLPSPRRSRFLFVKNKLSRIAVQLIFYKEIKREVRAGEPEP